MLQRSELRSGTVVSRHRFALVAILCVAAPGLLVGAADPNGARAEHAWVTPQIKAPDVSFHTFSNAAAKATVSYRLSISTACARDPDRRFPVVYWLHGSGGGLSGISKVTARFAEAIEAGKLPSCLVVFVNGMVNDMYGDWKDGSAPAFLPSGMRTRSGKDHSFA